MTVKRQQTVQCLPHDEAQINVSLLSLLIVAVAVVVIC